RPKRCKEISMRQSARPRQICGSDTDAAWRLSNGATGWLPDQPEHSVPAGFLGKMENNIYDLVDVVGRARPPIILARGLKRPVNDERLPDDILPRDEPPVTAVGAEVAVITHDKILTSGNDHVFTLKKVGKMVRPFGKRGAGSVFREIVAVIFHPGALV